MRICVLCRTNRRGRDDPRAFQLGQRRHWVVSIVERWRKPPQCYFKVCVQDGRCFVLCHDYVSGVWQLAAALPRA